MSPDDGPIGPVPATQPAHEAGLAYLQAARATGSALRSRSGDGQGAEPGLGVSSLDALVPTPGPTFPLALMLAALRPDARAWLGGERVRRAAHELAMTEAELLGMLDASPRPPLSLGDPLPWIGRRLPLLVSGVVVWVDLFWRPDRGARRRRIGAFAARLALPVTGQMEIRGRLEEHRLDVVAETERALPRPLAADLVDEYEGLVRRLGLNGTLTLRNPNA
ncbi:conserved protein of unknown function (plasmid) [Rhodovastum atsumiense]|uniref:hypothetical protein n=1 Tax=Rhodovastum atsumiense TaxID=504468 RepID=UPI0020251540|nr:hypothetical protein [Rhodovastum atsumiense]CAH2605526.1 conserved protein of unknown function [Rhodovastum atsumiense]